METLTIYRGNDEQIIIKLYTDSEKTNPINIDNLEDLEVRIFTENVLIDKWNKAGSGEFKALTKINPYTYYFWFETNDNSRTGFADLWIETKVSDMDLSDDIQNSISKSEHLFLIQQKPY